MLRLQEMRGIVGAQMGGRGSIMNIEKLTTSLQFIGAALALPAGAAGVYSAYHTYFSPEVMWRSTTRKSRKPRSSLDDGDVEFLDFAVCIHAGLQHERFCATFDGLADMGLEAPANGLGGHLRAYGLAGE